MATETTRTVEEIVDDCMPEPFATALAVYEAKAAADVFVSRFVDMNRPDHPVRWEWVDEAGIPRSFVEACQKVAANEIKLPFSSGGVA